MNMQIPCCKLHTGWEWNMQTWEVSWRFCLSHRMDALFLSSFLSNRFFIIRVKWWLSSSIFLIFFHARARLQVWPFVISLLALSFPPYISCRSLKPPVCFPTAYWLMWHAVYEGLFFNHPQLTWTIQLATYCLSNLTIALVKCYLW